MRSKFITSRATELLASLCAYALIAGCGGAKSGISAGGNPGTGAGSLASFKVLTFQGNPSTSWNTDTASVWKTNLNTVTITGTCQRGIASIQVTQKISGGPGAAVDSGVTANCVNNAFTWTKSFAADSNYMAAAAGSGVQFDFNIFALDGLGSQVVDSTALSAIKFYKLASTVLTSVKYYKAYIQQTVSVTGPNTVISDNPDPDSGGAGHCPTTTAAFTLTGTVDPQATLVVSGATSTNNDSGTTLSFLVCVPFGSTSVVVSTKDEAGTSTGTQYSINITSSTVLQTLGSATEGFKFQNLSPILAGLTSQGLSLINVSSDLFGKANTSSTGAAGYTLSTGLTSYVQQASP